jgi:hypothetical protein
MTLAADLLPTIEDIAVYVEGEATPPAVRRIRHLIKSHGLPAKKVGGRIQSRRSWLDAFYAEPDHPNGTGR